MSRFDDDIDDGYDGPPPSFYRRIERNNLLDCRDPDHDSSLCPHCGDHEDEEQPEGEEGKA